MKSSAGKSRSFQRTKVNHETSGKMQKHRSRDKISRAVKRFVLSDKDKNAQLGDDEEEVCHENNSQSTEIDSGNDIETQKSTETKPKKNMKKRASVAILVGKFESEVRAVRSKVSRVKLLNRASLDCGADSQKVQLASVSLPPAPVLHRATHSTSSTEPEDREVEFIFSSSGYNQGSDEELLFVPRGFNSNRLLRRKKAQRRKDFRGWTKSENGSPNMPRSVPDVISPSKPSPDMTENSPSMLPKAKHKLKAGDITSILKNRKSCDNRSIENIADQGSEVEVKKISCEITVQEPSRRRLPERQRSQSERGHRLDNSIVQKIKLSSTSSAPSAAFFLNNGNPLSSTSQPNLSKVLEAEGKEGEDRTKDVVYENREYRDRVSRASTPPLQRVSRASTPPLQRQFEEPLQGFHVVRPSSFQPREISTTPPRSVLVPKARTPVSSHHLEKLNSVETLLCEIMSRLDNLECCSRSSVRPNKVRQTRSKTKVSLKIRIFREQRQIRKHLSMIDKRTSLLTKKVDRLNSQTRIGKERPQQLDEILKFLQIEDFRGILEREHVSRDDFFLLNKPDLKEMGFPLGVRRRILNYIRN